MDKTLEMLFQRYDDAIVDIERRRVANYELSQRFLEHQKEMRGLTAERDALLKEVEDLKRRNANQAITIRAFQDERKEEGESNE